MFGRECTLCGGKLDSRKICKECGLDNSKSEKNYTINSSSSEKMPLTHVHEEMWGYPKNKRGCGCFLVFLIIFVIMAVIGTIGLSVEKDCSFLWNRVI